MAKTIPSESEIAAQKKKVADMEARRLEGLREKRKAAQKVVADLDAQIAAITGKGGTIGKRKRTSPAEMKDRIFGVLAKDSKLSQKEISDKTGLNYVSVANFLKAHRKEIGFSGDRKQRRYFLK